MENIKICIINNLDTAEKVTHKFRVMQQLWENDCIADIYTDETPELFSSIVNSNLHGLILHDYILFYNTIDTNYENLPSDWDICYFRPDKKSYLISNDAVQKVCLNDGIITDLLPQFNKYIITNDEIHKIDA